MLSLFIVIIVVILSIFIEFIDISLSLNPKRILPLFEIHIENQVIHHGLTLTRSYELVHPRQLGVVAEVTKISVGRNSGIFRQPNAFEAFDETCFELIDFEIFSQFVETIVQFNLWWIPNWRDFLAEFSNLILKLPINKRILE
jgi:hypothetical protein